MTALGSRSFTDAGRMFTMYKAKILLEEADNESCDLKTKLAKNYIR